MRYTENDIGKEMEGLIHDNEMSGAALIVRKHNEVVYKGKWGYADIENRKPVEYNTIYWLASMSKPITAVAIMQLIEKGKLNLDDPISKYLDSYAHPKVCAKMIDSDGSYQPDPNYPAGMGIPELLESMDYVPAKRQVTIRDLLSHSSGMGMGPVGMGFTERHLDTKDKLEERVEKWSDMPLDFQPGTAAGYSPIVGFDLLGRIVEVISRMDFQSYLRNNIWGPLGIKDITFTLSEEQLSRRAVLYTTENGQQHPLQGTDPLIESVDAMGAGYYSGAAGMCGSVEEYDKFTSMLCNGGTWNGVDILKSETVKQMQLRGSVKSLSPMPFTYWGLGMMVFTCPNKLNMGVTRGTYGWSGAFGTHMFVDPKRKLCATFVMNRSNIGGAGSPIARLVENLVFGIYK